MRYASLCSPVQPLLTFTAPTKQPMSTRDDYFSIKPVQDALSVPPFARDERLSASHPTLSTRSYVPPLGMASASAPHAVYFPSSSRSIPSTSYHAPMAYTYPATHVHHPGSIAPHSSYGVSPELFAKEEEEIKRNLALAESHRNPMYTLKAKIAQAKLNKAKERYIKAEAAQLGIPVDEILDESDVSEESSSSFEGKGKGKGKAKSGRRKKSKKKSSRSRERSSSKSRRSDSSNASLIPTFRHLSTSDLLTKRLSGEQSLFNSIHSTQPSVQDGRGLLHYGIQTCPPSLVSSPRLANLTRPALPPTHYSGHEPEYVDYRHARPVHPHRLPAYRGFRPHPFTGLQSRDDTNNEIGSHQPSLPSHRTLQSSYLSRSRILEKHSEEPGKPEEGNSSMSKPPSRSKSPSGNDLPNRPSPSRAPSANPRSADSKAGQPRQNLPETPPDQIRATIPLTKPIPRYPNQVVMEVIFPDLSYFLSFQQIKYDSPNVFSEALDANRHKLKPGKKLKVPIRDRNSQIFGILHDYCSGLPVVPLSSSHCAILTKTSVIRREAYQKLYDEAETYEFSKLQELVRPYLDIKEETSDAMPRQTFTSTVATSRPITPPLVNVYDMAPLNVLHPEDIDDLTEMTRLHKGAFFQKLSRLQVTFRDAAIK